jgi:hypothetical protein
LSQSSESKIRQKRVLLVLHWCGNGQAKSFTQRCLGAAAESGGKNNIQSVRNLTLLPTLPPNAAIAVVAPVLTHQVLRVMYKLFKMSRQQAAGSRQQAAGSRQQAAGSRQQAAGSIGVGRYRSAF